MKERIAYYEVKEAIDFEQDLNNFLESKKGSLVDIKFSTFLDTDYDDTRMSALIIYIPE